MKTLNYLTKLRSLFIASTLLLVTFVSAQTNVYDDVIAVSPDHTYLKTAIDEAGLAEALQTENATFTVFAPDNTAFEDLARALETDINGLLALENLSDVLLYHVLDMEASSGDINNGDLVTPLNNSNTLKLTVTSEGSVYVNQAMVNAADLITDNGIVHSMNAVLLPIETVADIAIDNDFTYLTAAVITAELLPALTDPFADYTVFAPDNMAFKDLAETLGTDIEGLLSLENLSDILLYHVLGVSAFSGDISNGDIVSPLNDANTIKLTATLEGAVYANQAMVTLADVAADNGVVHAIDAVILPVETVADIAIDNGFSYLTAAVVRAELLPALTNPFANFTVFAPDNTAFENLAMALDSDINEILNRKDLADILLYHVLGSSSFEVDLNNGGFLNPLNNVNTIKITSTSEGTVYANQAMVTLADVVSDNGVVHAIDAVLLPVETVADIAIDNGFSYLTAAVTTAELMPALTDPFADYTVFAPDNAAFESIAQALGTDIEGLLALENLTDILLYHVLGSSAFSGDLNNGDIVTPLNDANTIKLTVTSEGMVYTNQAMVTLADVTAENGVVHAINAVILPNETVADVAIDNGFSYLTTAIVTAELLPAITNPLADFTVFAPDDMAFEDLATALGTDINGLLALENLSEVLLYHVLDASTFSTDITNGDILSPIYNANTIKMTATSEGMVYANQAMVTLADVAADNGVVHAIDQVILPAETVVDVAIDNDFTSLTQAVITAELLPALTNPFAEYTVFAPDNASFEKLAETLDTDLNGILELSILPEVLLYHVIDGIYLSTDLENGSVTTLNGQDVVVDLNSGVMINDANVVLADVLSDNGVVHVIDQVLLPTITTSVDEIDNITVDIFPNPASDFINIVSNDDENIEEISIISLDGRVLQQIQIIENQTIINVSDYQSGQYLLMMNKGKNTVVKPITIL